MSDKWDNRALGLIKSISNYEPDLLQKIDSKELTINQAYEIVRDKHMTSKKSKKSMFSTL